jgi:hypothetical protein
VRQNCQVALLGEMATPPSLKLNVHYKILLCIEPLLEAGQRCVLTLCLLLASWVHIHNYPILGRISQSTPKSA